MSGSMIIVKDTIPVREDCREDAVALVHALAEASRSEEGCVAYEVYVQADQPEIIMIWQQWRSLDALEIHFASAHVDAFLDAIPDMIDGQVTSSRFEVHAEDSDLIDDEALELEMPRVLLGEEIVLH